MWHCYSSIHQDLTHYQTTKLRLFRIERLCRRQFQIWRNGRKLSKPLENTVGKGEIVRYEQFLLFRQCFQKACVPEASKGVIVWEWVKTPVERWIAKRVNTLLHEKNRPVCINGIYWGHPGCLFKWLYVLCSSKGRKYCGKVRNCWLPPFSRFSTLKTLPYFSGSWKSQIVWWNFKATKYDTIPFGK